jgi:hypothetical protein
MGDLSQLLFASVDDRVWKGEVPDTGATGPREDVHQEGFEMLRRDGDRRLATPQDRQRIKRGPRGARASIAEADDGEIDLAYKRVEVPGRPLAFVAAAVTGPPATYDRAIRF